MTENSDAQTSKRVVKLTAKGLADKIVRQQNNRKAKLNKGSALRKTIQDLMQTRNMSEFNKCHSDLL